MFVHYAQLILCDLEVTKVQYDELREVFWPSRLLWRQDCFLRTIIGVKRQIHFP